MVKQFSKISPVWSNVNFELLFNIDTKIEFSLQYYNMPIFCLVLYICLFVCLSALSLSLNRMNQFIYLNRLPSKKWVSQSYQLLLRSQTLQTMTLSNKVPVCCIIDCQKNKKEKKKKKKERKKEKEVGNGC